MEIKPKDGQYMARKSCKKCYGTGRIGYFQGYDGKVPVPCDCLMFMPYEDKDESE